jgi:hypothetical protein
VGFQKLERFEQEKAAERRVDAEADARRDLKRAVKELLPKGLKPPKRARGRVPQGGLTRAEVKQLRALADTYLAGADGLQRLEGKVQHTALVILLIDGVLGTEPWRAAGGPHGGIVAANARVRYLENAARLLADLRAARGGESRPQLLDGVIDAEVVDDGADQE